MSPLILVFNRSSFVLPQSFHVTPFIASNAFRVTWNLNLFALILSLFQEALSLEELEIRFGAVEGLAQIKDPAAQSLLAQTATDI